MSLDYKLTYLDKTFDCPICSDEGLSLGRVHKGGEDHPVCDPCARKWTAEKEHPACSICRKLINPASLLSKLERKEGAEKREQDRTVEFQRQYGEDERMASELAARDAGALGSFVATLIGDDDLARRLQAQEFQKQNPFCNCGTYVLGAVIFVAGVVLIETLRS